MKAATFASARVAHACRTSLNGGLKLDFRSGAVMGLVVVGLVLMDISIWFLILNHFIEDMAGGYKLMTITAIMLTFGMGASTQALFARVVGWAVGSRPRRPMWGPTWWVRLERGFLRTIRAIRQPLPIMWATM